MTEPRALLATVDLPPDRGGIQTMVREVCARSRVVASAIGPARGDPGLSVPFTGTHPTTGRARIMGLALGVRRAVGAQRPDVVLALHPLAAIGVPRSTPLVVFTHGGELRSPRIRRAAARAFSRASAVLANSEATARAAVDAGADRERLTVLLVGAPDPPDAPRIPADPFALFVGRLEPHKGADLAIDALAHLPRSLRLVVAGRGRERERLEARARAYDDRVSFAGAVDDDALDELMRSASVLVVPSRDLAGPRAGVEGGGIVALEAFVHRVPVVATATGGIPETVVDGETGFLVAPNDPEALARGVARALSGDAAPVVERAFRVATTERTWGRFTERLDEVLRSAAR